MTRRKFFWTLFGAPRRVYVSRLFIASSDFGRRFQFHRAGVDTSLVCDSSHAKGKYEHPEIQQLRLTGVPLVAGTSQKHKIMHHKFIVKDEVAVESGSWNFSLSASEESNYFDIIESSDRAALFLSKWKEMWDWISSTNFNSKLALYCQSRLHKPDP